MANLAGEQPVPEDLSCCPWDVRMDGMGDNGLGTEVAAVVVEEEEEEDREC